MVPASSPSSSCAIEPNPGEGYEFVDKITGGRIPASTSTRSSQGVEAALEVGVLAGFPTVDVKVTLVDGQYHDVDSSEMAFKIAGQAGFKEAAAKAGPSCSSRSWPSRSSPPRTTWAT